MNIRREIHNFLMITAGAIIAAFSIEDFLAPNNIFDGGIVGVSMIVSREGRCSWTQRTRLTSATATTSYTAITWLKV